MATFLELRVHGVHSTPPADMLGAEAVVQVGGDTITGVYRPTGDIPGRDIPDGSAVEAYSWGALTSGTTSILSVLQRMLWLTLLPFALANVASWARLTAGQNTGRSRVSAAAVRLFALTLSVFLILTPALVFSDLFAWQCFRGGTVSCPSIPEPLHLLAQWAPAQRLAFGMLPALLVVALLWWLSRLTHARYEDVRDPQARVLAVSAIAPTLLIRHPKMFTGQRRTALLRDLHVAAQLCAVTTFTAIHVCATSPSWWARIAVALGLLGLVIAMVLVCLRPPDDTDLPTDAQVRDRSGLALGIRRASLALALAWLAVLAIGRVHIDEGHQFVGHNVWFIGGMLMLTATHILVVGFERRPCATAVAVAVFLAMILAGACRWTDKRGLDIPQIGTAAVLALGFWAAMVALHLRSDSDDADPQLAPGSAAWRGAGASFLMGGAAWVALLFTAATVTFAANYLNGPDQGPGDLVSDADLAPQVAEPHQISAFVATGDLTIEGGVIVRTPTGLVIGSGTLMASRFSAANADPAPSVPTIAVQQATVHTEATTVRLRDVCLVTSLSRAAKCVPDARPARTSSSNGSRADAEATVVSDAVLTLEQDPTTKQSQITIEATDSVTLQSNEPITAHLLVPQVLIWTPIAQMVWLLGAGLLTVGILLRSRGARAALLASGQSDKSVDKTYRAAVAAARARAGLPHRVEAIVDGFGYLTTLLLLLLMALSFSGMAPWQLFGPGNPWGDYSGLARSVTDLSLWGAIGSSALLIGLTSRIRSSGSTRRAVGVLWDLATFWPRIAHPLAPPCYTERVVPEVSRRVRWARAKQPDGIVVLAGHSQGSLIAATVASRLDSLEKLRLLTFGSQIRGLYGRVFPRVFGPEAMGYAASTPTLLNKAMPDALDARSGYPQAAPPQPADDSLRARLEAVGDPDGGSPPWVNLFRRSDPLGFRVFADGDSPIDRPTEEVTACAGDPSPPLRGHSGYMFTTTYIATVAGWTGETVPAPATGVAPVPRVIPR